MLQRLGQIVRRFRRDLIIIWRALRTPGRPRWLIPACLGTLVYVISPMDLVPDFLLPFGFADDLLLLGLVLRQMVKHLPNHMNGEVEQDDPSE